MGGASACCCRFVILTFCVVLVGGCLLWERSFLERWGGKGGKGRITLPFCCYDDMVHTAIILFFFASYFFSEKGAWSVLDSLLKLSIQLALIVSITVLGGVLQS